VSAGQLEAALARALGRVAGVGPHRLILGAANLGPGRTPALCDPHQAQFWQVYLVPKSTGQDSILIARFADLLPATLLATTLARRLGSDLGVATMNFGAMNGADLPALLTQVDIFAREGDDLVPVSGRHLWPLLACLKQASSNHGRLALLAAIPIKAWEDCDPRSLPLPVTS